MNTKIKYKLHLNCYNENLAVKLRNNIFYVLNIIYLS